MLHRYSHREERSVADRDHPALARQIQHLGLMRENEFDAVSIDVIKRDTEFRSRITDICSAAWERKQAPRKL